ncbi:hypothetical protein Bbelb_151950 [Branchiostoma belcheri]|nr:hypothetical protein Bbelb_151950 [Branchiostoma belcheri]
MASGGKECPSSSIFLTSRIDDNHVLAANISDCAPKTRDLSKFAVPFQKKGSSDSPCKYIELYNLQAYNMGQLLEGTFQITTVESLTEKARQEVEEIYAYILQDSDTHLNYVVRHMKKYLTKEGQTAIPISCRELNRLTGRPIVLIKEQDPMVPQQIDESRLVIKANRRGEELTAEEETLVISLLRPVPPFGSQANPRRRRKKLSNSDEVKPKFTCTRSVPLFHGRGPVNGILKGYYQHNRPGYLGCGGNCPSCRPFIQVAEHAVRCPDVHCRHKELLVADYVDHVQTECSEDPCYIPFCKDSKHICFERGKLWDWVITDVIENIRRTCTV